MITSGLVNCFMGRWNNIASISDTDSRNLCKWLLDLRGLFWPEIKWKKNNLNLSSGSS